VKRVSGLGFTLILAGALLNPNSSAMAYEKFNWKIKKEETGAAPPDIQIRCHMQLAHQLNSRSAAQLQIST
jgi:hypothetical protein